MHTLYEPCPLENGVFTSHHGPWVLTVQVMSLEGIEQRQGQRLRRFCSLETLPVAAEAMPSDAVSRVLFASLGPNATRPSTVPMPLITRLRSRGLSAERLFQTPQPPSAGGPCRCACWMGFPAVHRWVHLRLQVLAPRKTNAHTPEKSHALHNLLAFFLCLVPFLASRTVHLHLESALGPGLLLELFLGGGATVGLGSEGWMSRQAWKRGLSSLSAIGLVAVDALVLLSSTFAASHHRRLPHPTTDVWPSCSSAASLATTAVWPSSSMFPMCAQDEDDGVAPGFPLAVSTASGKSEAKPSS